MAIHYICEDIVWFIKKNPAGGGIFSKAGVITR
ncbi:hypothetical protein SAMN04487787_12428 [Kosakonia sacchari]|nr:hypothetical protein SAMN04487787_12428 [Kosakonia sacchari]